MKAYRDSAIASEQQRRDRFLRNIKHTDDHIKAERARQQAREAKAIRFADDAQERSNQLHDRKPRRRFERFRANLPASKLQRDATDAALAADIVEKEGVFEQGHFDAWEAILGVLQQKASFRALQSLHIGRARMLLGEK